MLFVLIILISAQSVQARDYYTRKRVHGHWIHGHFLRHHHHRGTTTQPALPVTTTPTRDPYAKRIDDAFNRIPKKFLKAEMQ